MIAVVPALAVPATIAALGDHGFLGIEVGEVIDTVSDASVDGAALALGGAAAAAARYIEGPLEGLPGELAR
jgi:hypothetical protein